MICRVSWSDPARYRCRRPLSIPCVICLRVTEVHYNPAPPTSAEQAAGWTDNDDFEFVEVTNIGSSTLQLNGVRFVRDIPGGVSEGIGFDFASDATLLAGTIDRRDRQSAGVSRSIWRRTDPADAL